MQTTKIYEIPAAEIKNILIVRQHHQLGDMLCALPMYAAVRNKFPHARITLVASPYNGKVLQGTTGQYIDNILLYDKSSMISLVKFMNRILSSKFDLCIVPSTASISRTSHIICKLSGAKYRVGVSSIEGKRNKSAGYLNIKSDFFWDKDRKHHTERNLDIARQVGCDFSREEISLVRLDVPDKDMHYAEEYFAKNFTKDSPVAAFHPGAGKPQNRWNPDNFIKLIEKVHFKYGANILITNGSGDLPVSGKIIKELDKKNITVHAPVLSLSRLAAFLKKVDVYVSNDTGTMHVASYVNANVIGLFGPTPAFEWGPVNKKGSYIQSVSSDINDISTDEVFRAVEKYLN